MKVGSLGRFSLGMCGEGHYSEGEEEEKEYVVGRLLTKSQVARFDEYCSIGYQAKLLGL